MTTVKDVCHQAPADHGFCSVSTPTSDFYRQPHLAKFIFINLQCVIDQSSQAAPNGGVPLPFAIESQNMSSLYLK